MTKEEILAMQPGREMDGEIVKLLGFEVNSLDGMGYWVYVGNDQDACLFRPSENVRDAWHVVEKMRERIFSKRRVFLDNLQELTRYIGTIDRTVAWPDVFWFVNPESICKAALLAVMEGKDEE
ncbi:hypothetical protein QFZ77_002426 [Paenibacillus sp. V4I3]|uniref:hypothetical protein n=1 Tax=Paenibacillus sp. V4I3 TaxID=3042305 RepID=UPI00278593C0|nr:hypothetical protein [Paenibacillus sp. V4I3]MDQ0873767.1 hypothetical protein [Paenibacillus sp. V4I3]